MSANNKVVFKSFTLLKWNQLYQSGKVDSSVAYQRGDKVAWNKPEKVIRLIDSILKGWSINVLHVLETPEGVYELIDGKQRTRVIFQIFNGVSLDADGLAFVDWSAEDRESFSNYEIPVIVLSGLDDNERREVFERLNSGVALTSNERVRGSLLKYYGDSAFVASAELVRVCLAGVAGREVSRDSAEVVLSQAIAYNLPSFSGFGGAEVASAFKAADVAVVSDLAGKIGVYLAGGLVAALEADTDKSCAWVRKSSGLAGLLAYIGKSARVWDDNDWVNLVGFNPVKKNWKELGTSQSEYLGAVQAASGTKTSADVRVKVFASILAGVSSKNAAKDVSISSSGKDDKKKGLVSKSALASVDSVFNIWGEKKSLDELPSRESVGKVLSHLESAGFSSVLARVEKSGVLSFSAIDKKMSARILAYNDLAKIVLNPVVAEVVK